ncbi:MAG: alanine:cation symporter family protein [Candidatus Gastranaerophilaceae bacterium]
MYTTTPAGIRERERKRKGELSSFQALSATISASAGIGNVAGSAGCINQRPGSDFLDDYSRTSQWL